MSEYELMLLISGWAFGMFTAFALVIGLDWMEERRDESETPDD